MEQSETRLNRTASARASPPPPEAASRMSSLTRSPASAGVTVSAEPLNRSTRARTSSRLPGPVPGPPEEIDRVMGRQ
ncbi:hypothetical protein GCM10010295_02800 [Streptomyces intermedius]